MDATCEELQADIGAVMDLCTAVYLDSVEPGDPHDALAEAVCDHLANDCGYAEYEACVDEFWTGPNAEIVLVYLAVKDEILEEIIQCFDDLAADECDQADFDACGQGPLAELDTCGG
jgi:hypothetical protein